MMTRGRGSKRASEPIILTEGPSMLVHVARKVLIVAAALAVVKSSVASGEPSPASDHGIPWEEYTEVPTWVTEAPRRDGYVRVLDGAQSNLLELAYSFDKGLVLGKVKSEVAHRLRPTLGVDADKVVDSGLTSVTLARRGYYTQRPPKGQPPFPGDTLITAWVLWEAPLAPLLKGVSAAQREAVQDALLQQTGPKALPAWEDVSTAPSWSRKPLIREGQLSVPLTEVSGRRDVAQANAMVMGRLRLLVGLADLLEASLGRPEAVETAKRAVTWRVLRARASSLDTTKPTVWTLWDIPLERVLASAPTAKQADVRKALERLR